MTSFKITTNYMAASVTVEAERTRIDGGHLLFESRQGSGDVWRLVAAFSDWSSVTTAAASA